MSRSRLDPIFINKGRRRFSGSALGEACQTNHKSKTRPRQFQRTSPGPHKRDQILGRQSGSDSPRVPRSPPSSSLHHRGQDWPAPIRSSRAKQEMATGTDGQGSVPAAPREDFRVLCTSKRAVSEMLALCGDFVQKLGDVLPQEIREPALRDAQWTFESAVQENISINGEAWHEASDNCLMEADIKVLEDQFDELIVDTATKRKQYPRKILACVIKMLKAKQEIMKQYRPVVHPLDLKHDCDSAMRMENLKHRGTTVAKELNDAMKSLPLLIEQADGFSHVIRMQPVIQLQRVHQEIFSSHNRKPDIKPDSCIAHLEATPARKTTNMVLKRKRTKDCPQRKWYPLRPKRIHLNA
ncbi:kinetochore-associated protein NSL1 homolog [Rhynchocyon petersi]